MEQLLVLAQIFYREEFPFPGELSCTGFPEKKSRNTGKLSLKHLQMLRGLHFLADTVAALLHPCAEVLWKLHQRRQKANLARFWKLRLSPEALISWLWVGRWPQVGLRYTCDTRLILNCSVSYRFVSSWLQIKLELLCLQPVRFLGVEDQLFTLSAGSEQWNWEESIL